MREPSFYFPYLIYFAQKGVFWGKVVSSNYFPLWENDINNVLKYILNPPQNTSHGTLPMHCIRLRERENVVSEFGETISVVVEI